MGYYEGNISDLSTGYNNSGMWGGDGIWAILLLALLGGGYGFGRGNFGGGTYSEALGYELGKVATTNDVASGFNNSAVLGGINSIKENQLQMQNFINQGFSGLSSQLIGEFRNVDNAVCSLGYNLSHQISDCCCQTQRAIDNINFNNAKNTCDIVQAINLGNQRVIDYMQSEKIDTLNRKLAVAEGQISQYAQTNAIISALQPKCPIPSYTVPNPNCCYGTCGGTTL